MLPKVGFIGLGSQGGPMAQRIAEAGYPLVVWARRLEATAHFVAAGALRAERVSELGATCDVVGVCVVDDAGVQAICQDLVPTMRPGSVLAIHSTILPETCEALAKQCAARGIHLIDAPVSGGGGAAAAGTLTVMCGGSAEAFAASREVLQTFGGTVVLLGPAGAGQRAKIVNNALMAANMGLAQAAVEVGKALGIESVALAELIKVSSGRSFGFEVFARLPQPSAFAHGASLLNKDVNLLAAIAPGEPSMDMLRNAAKGFLADATGTMPKETAA